MRPRAPWRSTHRPAGMAATPATSCASENAPVTCVLDQPSSAPIGVMKAAKPYDRMP